MFRGIHALTLDAKGRLAIPSKHRDALAAQCLGRLVCTIDPDSRCLWLYPLPAWEEIEHILDTCPASIKPCAACSACSSAMPRSAIWTRKGGCCCRPRYANSPRLINMRC